MDACCQHEGSEIAALALKKDQRRVLVVVLAINAAMFFHRVRRGPGRAILELAAMGLL